MSNQIDTIPSEMVNVPLTDDKKSIQEEEKEQILKIENEEKPIIDSSEEKRPPKEGMEVKPKKIPIGGIQMPGFFTRSKSKEHCKDGDLAEESELIEQSSDTKGETSTTSQLRVKLPNPFKKNKTGDVEEGEKSAELKDKKTLLQTIRLPLASVFNFMKKTPDNQNGAAEPGNQPGLASMETLDEKSNTSTSDVKNTSTDEKKEEEKNEENYFALRQTLEHYKLAIGTVGTFLLFAIVIIIITSTRSSVPMTPPIRNGKFIEAVTSCGKVEGQMEDSAFAFRGIPYARPPINDLRFKYAEPLNNLEYCWNGTFLAHNITTTCMQISEDGSITGDEDCLTLDIVTPHIRYDNPLPVIVLIGANSFIGDSPGKMRPSARYARSRDVVFVRPNFRLGVLGFLSLDILSKDDYPHTSGNYGLSDILEALKWIQLNIEHFGGNKHSVTLFGHKAGATLVTALTTIPKAKEYFTRAWASSGGGIYPEKPRQESEIDFKSYLNSIRCTDAACLRKVDAEKLVSAVPDIWRKPQPDLPSKYENSANRHQWLVIDGKILKESPNTVWKNKSSTVKLVIGSTSQAGSTDKLLLKHTNWTGGFIRQHIKESYLGSQNLTDTVLKMYPSTYDGLSRMVTDIRIVCPLFELWNEIENVTFYIVTRTRFTNQIADIDSDIDAILGRYEPKTPEQRRYVSAMQQLFYHFVWHDKIEKKSDDKHILIVNQDVLANTTYSHCDFWREKNMISQFAALD